MKIATTVSALEGRVVGPTSEFEDDLSEVLVAFHGLVGRDDL